MTLYTKKAIARVLGMSESEIQAMVSKGIIKKGVNKSGLFKLEETAREVIAALGSEEKKSGVLDYKSERALLVRTQRENAELDLQLRRGELHKTEDIELALTKVMMNFKASVRAIPAKAAPMAEKMDNSADIYDMLAKMVDEALEEMSDYDKFGDGEQ